MGALFSRGNICVSKSWSRSTVFNGTMKFTFRLFPITTQNSYLTFPLALYLNSIYKENNKECKARYLHRNILILKGSSKHIVTTEITLKLPNGCCIFWVIGFQVVKSSVQNIILKHQHFVGKLQNPLREKSL